MLLGSDALVTKRGMLPSVSISPSPPLNGVAKLHVPPASLLVAIRHSTSPPPSLSVTRSTETYFPRTLDFSAPCFSGQSGCANGIDTAVSDRALRRVCAQSRHPRGCAHVTPPQVARLCGERGRCISSRRLTVHKAPLAGLRLQLLRQKQDDKCPWRRRRRSDIRQPPHLGHMRLKHLQALRLAARLDVLSFILSSARYAASPADSPRSGTPAARGETARTARWGERSPLQPPHRGPRRRCSAATRAEIASA